MHKIRFLLPVIPIGMGVFTLIGWGLNLDVLQRGGYSSAVAMNPVTAIGFTFLGLEVLRLYAGKNHVVISSIGQFAIGAVIITSVMKLCDVVLGTSFSVDQWFFAANLNANLLHPNRMAPNTALCFFFLGLSLQVVRFRKKSSVAFSQVLAALSAMIALLAIVGYVYGVKSLYDMGVFFPMTVSTAITFIFLCWSVLGIQPNRGYLRVFTSGGVAGKVSSILLPATFIAPFLLGWITLNAKRAGILDDAFEAALSIILDVAIFCVLSYISIRTLFFSDLRRQKVLVELQNSVERINTILGTVADGVITINEHGIVETFNPAATRMFGYATEEVIGHNVKMLMPEPYHSQHDGYLEHYRFTGKSKIIGTGREVEGQTKEGMVFPLDLTVNEMWLNGQRYFTATMRDLTERKRAEDRANRDSLTGLFNHHTFYVLLDDEIVRSKRYNRPVSLLMLDIDHFKTVNDIYGHQAGDAVLKQLSNSLIQQARTIDRVCRYGGEEFMVILSETNTASAMNTAERLRTTVEHQQSDIGGGKYVGITVSIGVATYPHQAKSPQELVKAADKALYAAKAGGRNRVCCHDDSAI